MDPAGGRSVQKNQSTIFCSNVAVRGLAASGHCLWRRFDARRRHSTESEAAGGKIALLLPESKTARYETQDRPLFEAKVKAICPSCEILYSNADQDATKQQSQAEAALTNGAQVLVLDPVDAKASASIATQAKAKGVPVISYDRLVLGGPVDYYVSFDNEKVGNLQGQGAG